MATSAQEKGTRRWSRRVMETSDALDLEQGVFRKSSATDIAKSLERSAKRSRRRKSDPFRSAMSMLVFYINRAGKTLTPSRRRTLERAKDELRELFGRPRRAAPRPRRAGSTSRRPTRAATPPRRTSRRGRVDTGA